MRIQALGASRAGALQYPPPCFLVDNTLLLDVGTFHVANSARAHAKLKAVLLTHAHFDHLRDLPGVLEMRAQLELSPVTLAATGDTLEIVRAHVFNGAIWPDFSKIPTPRKPAVRYRALEPGTTVEIAGYAVTTLPSTHCRGAAAFIIDDGTRALVYTGDTGSDPELWRAVDAHPRISTVLIEVSFPNRLGSLARRLRHHTPRSLRKDVHIMERASGVQVLLHHIKPAFTREVVRELDALTWQHDVRFIKPGESFSVPKRRG